MFVVDISVIIPVFNRAHTIGRCLDSVLGQTYPVTEVLLVDDCSTDDLESVLLGYNDTRIKHIRHDRNLGAQAARNTGIQSSNCRWVAFQDSDDEWGSQKIEKQVAALSGVKFEPFTVVHCNATKVLNGGKSHIPYILPTVEGSNCYDLLLKTPGPMYQGILTSKMALNSIGRLDETLVSHQEWDTSIRLAKRCNYIHVQETLVTYHIQSEGTISGNKENQIIGYEQVFDKHVLQNDAVDENTIFNHYLSLYIKSSQLNLNNARSRFWKLMLNYDKRELYKISLLKLLGKPLTELNKTGRLINLIVEAMFRVKFRLLFR
ncbi:MAG: glycosyltransferase [Cytophagales bacterium]